MKYGLVLYCALIFTSQSFAAVGLDTKGNMDAVTEAIVATGFEWEPTAGELCRNEKYCSIYVGDVLIVTAVGRTVEVLPSSEVSEGEYLLLCASILSALSGRDMESTQNSVNTAYVAATFSGNFEDNFGRIGWNVEVSGSEIGCEFVVGNA